MTGRVWTEDEADTLARRLLDPDRRLPVVVISTPHWVDDPLIDANSVEEAVSGLAEVVVIRTGPATRHYAAALPPRTEVYGGAGRVYPLDPSWQADPYRSPLRFAYTQLDGARACRQLIDDAMAMAAEVGLLTPAVERSADVRGQVRGLIGSTRALVDLDGGGQALVLHELLYPTVPLENTLLPGMAVHGTLDTDTRRLDLRPRLPDARTVLGQTYRPGDTVLVRVRQVERISATLELHPEVITEVSSQNTTGDPADDLTDLLTAGEVLPARVLQMDGDGVHVSLVDLPEQPAVVPAPPLVPGGPPWIRVADYTPAVVEVLLSAGKDAPTPAPDAGATRPAVDVMDEAAVLRAELERVISELEGVQRQLAAKDAQLGELRRSRRAALQQRQRASVRDADGLDPDALLPDPEQQFRFDVYLTWARTVPSGEKGNQPLPPYTVGPDFLASLDRIEGIGRGKVVEVTVQVLTGIADTLASREVRQLREGRGGSDPPVRRADGATCWRVSLQTNTPAARRLHFWRRVDGSIELSRVVTHDDMTP
jgi:hypothetical protein